MTNINCTVSCIYQKDGKCCLDKVDTATEVNKGCAYFKEKDLMALKAFDK